MENTTDENLLINKKYNSKLFLIYKAISWDLLFFYTISFLFLTQEKGLTTSEIIFGEAFYPLFKFLLQIPATIIVEKLGKRKSIIFANSLIVLYVLLIIGLVNVWTFAIANIFCALGYIIKGMSEPSLLYDSLDPSENKQEVFSKIEGKGVAWYFYIDSISAVITGFLFVFNSYLPMFITLIITILATILSTLFKKLPNDKLDIESKNKTIASEFIAYYKDLLETFKFIFNSKRLKALLIFHGVFTSFLYIMISLNKSLLAEVNVSSEQFGIIFAFLGIIGGISADYSYKYHKTYQNRTLAFLSITFGLSVLFSGLAVLFILPKFLMYFIILICFTLQYITRTPYTTLIRQYLGSFSTSSMRVKILSAAFFIEGTTNALLSFICSKILEFLPTNITVFLLGAIFTLIIIVVLEYMKTRVGLKPEEYSKKDILDNEVNK